MEITIPPIDDTSVATMRIWLHKMHELQAKLVDAVVNILENNQQASAVIIALQRMFATLGLSENDQLLVVQNGHGFSVKNSDASLQHDFLFKNNQWCLQNSSQPLVLERVAQHVLYTAWWGDPDACHHIFQDRCFFIDVDRG